MAVHVGQWVECHRALQGVELVVLFDHVHNALSPARIVNSTSDSLVWDAVAELVGQGAVTYVDFRMDPSPVKGWDWYFQYTQLFSCVRRFRFDAKYMILADLDEWLMVNPWFNVSLALPQVTHRAVIDRLMSGSEGGALSDRWLSGVRSLVDLMRLLYTADSDVALVWFRRLNGFPCARNDTPVVQSPEWNGAASAAVNVSGAGEWRCSDSFVSVAERSGCLLNAEIMGKLIVDAAMAHTVWQHSLFSFVDRTTRRVVDRSPSSSFSEHAFGRDWLAELSWPQRREYGKRSMADIVRGLPFDPVVAVHTSDHLDEAVVRRAAAGMVRLPVWDEQIAALNRLWVRRHAHNRSSLLYRQRVPSFVGAEMARCS